MIRSFGHLTIACKCRRSNPEASITPIGTRLVSDFDHYVNCMARLVPDWDKTFVTGSERQYREDRGSMTARLKSTDPAASNLAIGRPAIGWRSAFAVRQRDRRVLLGPSCLLRQRPRPAVVAGLEHPTGC